MKKDYLLEIGLEEIPARFMCRLLDDLKEKAKDLLKKYQLIYEKVEVWGTYRRLVLVILGLEQKQPDITKEFKGPSLNLAFDKDGKVLPAGIGFAKKVGIAVEELGQKEENGQKYLLAKIEEKGQATEAVLPQLIKEMVSSINQPIAMRWGDLRETFIRPVHWVLSMYGKKVIPFEIFGIKAGNKTRGHRFLTQNKSKENLASGVEVKVNTTEYFKIVKELKVILDQNERKKKILKALIEFIPEEKIDTELLEEVTYLVEYPTSLVGKLDKKYLKLPDEVLIQSMKKNQKVFPVFDKNKLTEKFVIIAENVTAKSKENIIAGNENVISARMEDAEFFYEEDQKQKLESNVEKLKGMMFQKNLGTMYDKTKRLQKLAQYLAKELDLGKYEKEIFRAGLLAKADLRTRMVFEFPALQGTMGRIYAKINEEEKAVYDAIFEHYLPRFTGDKLPQTEVGLVLAIADKTDTLIGSFYNNLIPTGSQDPWGVRRSAIGIINIVFGKKLNINLREFVLHSYSLFKGEKKNLDKCLEFLAQRIKNALSEQKISYDTVEAVMHLGLEKPILANQMALVIDSFRKKYKDDFKLLIDTGVRVKRIAPKDLAEIKIEKSKFLQDEEKNSFNKFVDADEKISQLLDKGKIEEVLKELVKISLELSIYFDKVLVIHQDQNVKNNRLAFLGAVNQLFSQIFDAGKIVL